MKDSNPFKPTQTPVHPAAVTTPAMDPKTGGRSFEIFHNTLRGFLAFLFLGFTPVFVAPQFANFFAEFGMELPLVALLFIQFSNLACRAPVIYLPLSFVLLAGIECGIFFFPAGIPKTLINIVYWLALILLIGAVCLTFFMVLERYISSLTAAVVLSPQSPHLLRI